MNTFTAADILKLTRQNVLALYHKELNEANAHELHNALGGAVMALIAPDWKKTEEARQHGRQASYLSAEYLVGRLVSNNLLCLGVLDETEKLFAEAGAPLTAMEEIEDDAFGNGGLGRLAACFLDSAASLRLPLTGYGLRYRYGLFYQYFEDGYQKEAPDDWSRYGDPWSIRREDRAVIVPIRGLPVRAVPYDMPVIGNKNGYIGTLRLWQTESLSEIDFAAFNDQKYKAASAGKNAAEDIVKFLYPNDTTRAGKLLRLKQQYVLSSASLQDMLRDYEERHGQDYSAFASEYAVQLNDTHPTLAIPELIRLLENRGVTFEDALAIARKTFAYTNHTVMQEALEKWDLSLLRSLSPEIAAIIRQIDAFARRELGEAFFEKAPECVLTDGKRAHMANLAVYCSFAVNGVAAIHTEILKNDLFHAWHSLYPDRIQNKTNGITQRRWLGLCNPELTHWLNRLTGSDVIKDPMALNLLKDRINDDTAREFLNIKQVKKEQLSSLLQKREGVLLPPDFIFDVQIKRLHEYKRQLLNILSIIAIYEGLKDGSIKDFTPTAFLFGAKAAPGYVRAKAVIRLINKAAEIINEDEETNDRLRVLFVHNYDCSYAEKIIPAADVSEQISPAGTEASGTGNMKLMMNGAVTLGTMDGANIEIVEQAGLQNNYIFGATVDKINAIRKTYDPNEYIKASPRLASALSWLKNGPIPDEDGSLRELYDALTIGASWHKPDHYFLALDFDSYLDAKLLVNREYTDRIQFAKKALYNIAGSGIFSSDRTIRQYAEEIWAIRPAGGKEL